MAIANECNPYFETSDVTATVTADVTGKRFVAPSADRESGPGLSNTSEGSNYRVAHAGAGAKALGVAAYDVKADGSDGHGKKVPILGQSGKIVPVTTDTGGVAAGAEVEVGATGKAKTLAAGRPVGLCVSGAAAGLDAEVRLY